MKSTLRSLSLAAAAVLVLGACASADKSRVSDAATTPLNDLNLVNAPIPELLKTARRAPYAMPPDSTCEALTQQVRALDEVLGPDLDTPPTPSNPGLIERGTNAVGDAAVGALKGAAQGVVPFRGWVRKLTGAERYSRDVQAAIAAGTVRRAYLKGLAAARACSPTAAAAAVAS